MSNQPQMTDSQPSILDQNQKIAAELLIGHVVELLNDDQIKKSPILEKISNLGIDIFNPEDLRKFIMGLALGKFASNHELIESLKNPENAIDSILCSIFLKSFHQLFGAYICEPEKQYLDLRIKIIISLVNITDVIDTFTDSSRDFLGLGSTEQELIRSGLFNYYMQIFTDDEIKMISSGSKKMDFLINYIRKECLQVRETLKDVMELFNVSDEASLELRKLLHQEASKYVDGVIKMDTVNFTNWSDYINQVTSKVSNLSLLGLIDIISVGDALEKENLIDIMASLELYNSDHIAQDDISDYTEDNKKNINNIWEIFLQNIKDNKASEDQLVNILVKNVSEGLSGFNNEILKPYHDHWKKVLAIKLKLYLSKTDFQELPPELSQIIMKYKSEMQAILT